MLITREQALAFAEKQFDEETGLMNKEGGCWHYGKQEVQQLLDHIYGVNSKGEKVFCEGEASEDGKDENIKAEIEKVEKSLDEGEA